MMRTFVLLTIHQNICAENPHIYKNFLETLQRYQQEFLPIQDTYAIITRLFEDYPHLVEEFKTFLPESAAAARRNRLRRGKASLRRVEMRRKSMRRTYLPQY
jgi:histone deacetylase complex regulatory component SIN3